jgi:deazaflavin-dependent oxidoreductase (nitroreductase family)
MMSDDSANNDMANAMANFNTTIIEEFRANHGRVGGGFEGASLLLLHTKGAKSGAERINPVAYLESEGRIYVFASKAGADTDPDWYRNLRANPSVTIEIGSETLKATAKPLSGAERDRIYSIQKMDSPAFADYEKKTTRVIPVIELVR